MMKLKYYSSLYKINKENGLIIVKMFKSVLAFLGPTLYFKQAAALFPLCTVLHPVCV